MSTAAADCDIMLMKCRSVMKRRVHMYKNMWLLLLLHLVMSFIERFSSLGVSKYIVGIILGP